MTKLIGFLVGVVIASAQVPHIYPRVLLPGDAVGGSFWLSAQDIAVVRIETVEWVGPEIEITPPQKIVVRLISVAADVESVIRGTLPVGRIRFYTFANTLSQNGYHTVLAWMEKGARYIVFLREDGGTLRTVADVASGSIRIWSGRHDPIPTSQADPARQDPGMAIALLALTPSADVDRGFSINIQRTSDNLSQFVPPKEIASLLRGLLIHSDAQVRAQACLTLSRNFSYRDPCLPRLLSSTDEAIRQQAQMWSRMKSPTQALLKSLREDPFSLSISGRIKDFPGDLELFTFDSDPSVRQQACDTLRRLFPPFHFPNCARKPTGN
jgi:hypothetical protein